MEQIYINSKLPRINLFLCIKLKKSFFIEDGQDAEISSLNFQCLLSKKLNNVGTSSRIILSIESIEVPLRYNLMSIYSFLASEICKNNDLLESIQWDFLNQTECVNTFYSAVRELIGFYSVVKTMHN